MGKRQLYVREIYPDNVMMVSEQSGRWISGAAPEFQYQAIWLVAEQTKQAIDVVQPNRAPM